MRLRRELNISIRRAGGKICRRRTPSFNSGRQVDWEFVQIRRRSRHFAAKFEYKSDLKADLKEPEQKNVFVKGWSVSSWRLATHICRGLRTSYNSSGFRLLVFCVYVVGSFASDLTLCFLFNPAPVGSLTVICREWLQRCFALL